MKGHELGAASCPPTILCSSKLRVRLGPDPQANAAAIPTAIVGSTVNGLYEKHFHHSKSELGSPVFGSTGTVGIPRGPQDKCGRIGVPGVVVVVVAIGFEG